jgi:large subunit ribosomal protein L30
MADRLRVTQIKSTIGHIARNRGTVRALGLRRIGDTVEIPDNPATRGMVRQVRFLVTVESVAGERPARSRRGKDETTVAPEVTATAPEPAASSAEPTPSASASAPETDTSARADSQDTAPKAEKAPAARRTSRARKAATDSATEEGS